MQESGIITLPVASAHVKVALVLRLAPVQFQQDDSFLKACFSVLGVCGILGQLLHSFQLYKE